MPLLAATILFSLSPHPALAADYTLFDPVPEDRLRPINTERPNKTDSAVTVDAGHVQIESSAYSYTQNDDAIGGARTKNRQHAFGQTTNLRIGLTENSDFQIITDLYRDFETKDESAGTASVRSDGIGDTVLRAKYSFTGNEGESWAVAAIPFVKLPTASSGLGNDRAEYGFALPLAWTLPNGYALASEPIVQMLKKPDERGYYAGYTDSLVLYKTFSPAWAAYVEGWAFYPDDGAQHWQATGDLGVIYAVNDRLHLDAGTNIGLTEAADDLNVFVGGAYRY